ncbi:NAD(P)H-hydrate dehydratase [Brevibacillus humidisoli]|uniref:NAD(P)H-hydrate dehydratase n=1 Tax=Brevibacillus humidisoli TaxID=2895522 RepID=UPI001E4CF92C|nr:NAD(P)H-hydrate dehydratase [Brevibacillus humidisoli]UFJ42581.1 NAD(P)H-hydrate dehydratase [Brevibacillus humidisoli]
MFVVTADEMRRLDQYVIDQIGIPAIALMENAGAAVAREVVAFTREKGEKRTNRPLHWLLLIGKGNNGGDGLVAARHLVESGIDVTLLYAEPPEEMRGDAARQRDAAERLGIPASVYGSGSGGIDWQSYDGVVDALLGTGSRGAPRGPYAELIRMVNDSGLPILAVDIPSGLDADTGRRHDPCIQAAKTICFAFLKRGLVQSPGRETAGEVTVAPIGIWPQHAAQLDIRCFQLGKSCFRERLHLDPTLPRKSDTHKGTYGHLLVVAGSMQMSGAGFLCTKAALRTGCGLATWAVPEALVPSLIGLVPEAILAAIPGGWTDSSSAESVCELVHGRDAVVIGPGIGRFSGDTNWLRTIWEQSDCPLVLDADALNMLSDAADFSGWPQRRAATLLTPHPGEMSRLTRLSTSELQANRVEVARTYAVDHQLTVVLKGAGTVVASPDGTTYINPTGNPGMSTGGSGDVLAGMIGSLLAQGLTAEQAACLAVWLHGKAGDRVAAQRGTSYSLIASDLIDAL